MGNMLAGVATMGWGHMMGDQSMKAFPKPGREIQLEVENEGDWRLLTQLLADAATHDFDLAAEVCSGMVDDDITEDWREFVVPDLRDAFDESLARVVRMIDEARQKDFPGSGRVVIAPDVCMDWYGVLNRARLALESRHRVAAYRKAPTGQPEIHAAALRDRLYCALQSLLLDHSLS